MLISCIIQYFSRLVYYYSLLQSFRFYNRDMLVCGANLLPFRLKILSYYRPHIKIFSGFFNPTE